MSTQNLTNLTVPEAQKVLTPFNCLEGKTVNSESERDCIRQALLLLTEHSDYQIFGVCADTTNQGLAALKNYVEALGYKPNFDITPIDGPVYIKHNPNTGLCYLDSYTGVHRGVLVSYQSSDDQGVNEMYGHLPLDLFV